MILLIASILVLLFAVFVLTRPIPKMDSNALETGVELYYPRVNE